MNHANSNNKTPSYWFAINKHARKVPAFKAALNGNADILAAVATQATALTAVATKLGFSLSSAGVDFTTIKAAPFPIPYLLWSGVMAFDTTTKDGDTSKSDNRAAFAKAATKLRRAAVKIRLAFRELKDAANVGTAETGNPGGVPVGGTQD